jgi:hypothetical protein
MSCRPLLRNAAGGLARPLAGEMLETEGVEE